MREALQNEAWLDDFGRGLSVTTIWEFLQLWEAVHEVTLTAGKDVHRWLPHASGSYTSRSAYLRFSLLLATTTVYGDRGHLFGQSFLYGWPLQIGAGLPID